MPAPMSALLANLAVAVALLLLGLSLLLAAVGLMTWRRVGHGKLGWVTLAFALFAAQGAYLTRDAYQRRGDLAQGWDVLPYFASVNLLIVLALYLAVLKR